MRIGIDCRLSGPEHAGIGRYIENLISRLPHLAPNITWVYFVADATQIPGKLPDNVEVMMTPVRHYSLAEQLQLPALFGQAKLDLLHIPHFNVPVLYRGPVIITIHDLLWHEYRGANVTTLHPIVYWSKYLAYRFVASRAIARAHRILVPAETIKRTLSKYYPKTADKVVITKEGIAAHFYQTPRALKPLNISLPKNKKILLYVGSLYPHKNIVRVLQALPKLKEYHLAIVGSRNVFQEETKLQAQKYGVESQISFLGYLSDAELRALMNQAHALVQPSLSEGFGLTGVEAMAANLPVLASQIPIFQEIYGKAAQFFDPKSTESFIKAVTTLDSRTYTSLQAAGLKQAKLYTWDNMTQMTLEVYRSVLTQK